MSLTERKYKFIEQFMKIADIKEVAKFEKLLNQSVNQDTKVVSHTIQGFPLTKESYFSEIQKAENEIISGKFISAEDLEIESENW